MVLRGVWVAALAVVLGDGCFAELVPGFELPAVWVVVGLRYFGAVLVSCGFRSGVGLV